MSSWEEYVRKVTPYTPGEQPKRTDIIKLNTNENPYPPAPGVANALQRMDAGMLRLYPDPSVGDLVHEIAVFYGVEDEQVFVGVGSDDVLAMIFLTFFNSGKPILFPDITYSFYDVWADMLRIPYRQIPLDSDFGFSERITGSRTGVWYSPIRTRRPESSWSFRRLSALCRRTRMA